MVHLLGHMVNHWSRNIVSQCESTIATLPVFILMFFSLTLVWEHMVFCLVSRLIFCCIFEDEQIINHVTAENKRQVISKNQKNEQYCFIHTAFEWKIMFYYKLIFIYYYKQELLLLLLSLLLLLLLFIIIIILSCENIYLHLDSQCIFVQQ